MKKGTKIATVIFLISITIGFFLITVKYRDSFISLISGLLLGFAILADIAYILTYRPTQGIMAFFKRDHDLVEETGPVGTEQETMSLFEQNQDMPEESEYIDAKQHAETVFATSRKEVRKRAPKINAEKYAKECNAWCVKQERNAREGNTDDCKIGSVYTAQDLKIKYGISFFQACSILEHLIDMGYINKDFCALCQDVTIELEIKNYLSNNAGIRC